MIVLQTLAAGILSMLMVIVLVEFIGRMFELRDKIKLKRRNR